MGFFSWGENLQNTKRNKITLLTLGSGMLDLVEINKN
jgi:hypothetical protein